ncbi:hypothetical protein QTO34_001898 [Cnephaeus nilssonii]|uniref:Uncharacterized protein n=1 Tax=Cnephaeus nilssonii TaxID=3371016 RepID=A0AA40LMU1_CNENI|nr:hypothetical protein QTO34_001898 [Eptesicus nilssonii]
MATGRLEFYHTKRHVLGTMKLLNVTELCYPSVVQAQQHQQPLELSVLSSSPTPHSDNRTGALDGMVRWQGRTLLRGEGRGVEGATGAGSSRSKTKTPAEGSKACRLLPESARNLQTLTQSAKTPAGAKAEGGSQKEGLGPGCQRKTGASSQASENDVSAQVSRRRTRYRELTLELRHSFSQVLVEGPKKKSGVPCSHPLLVPAPIALCLQHVGAAAVVGAGLLADRGLGAAAGGVVEDGPRPAPVPTTVPFRVHEFVHWAPKEKRKGKKQHLLQSPHSSFTDVKCPGCYKSPLSFGRGLAPGGGLGLGSTQHPCYRSEEPTPNGFLRWVQAPAVAQGRESLHPGFPGLGLGCTQRPCFRSQEATPSGFLRWVQVPRWCPRPGKPPPEAFLALGSATPQRPCNGFLVGMVGGRGLGVAKNGFCPPGLDSGEEKCWCSSWQHKDSTDEALAPAAGTGPAPPAASQSRHLNLLLAPSTGPNHP